MPLDRKTRNEIAQYFLTGLRPKEGEFQQFFESCIFQIDDGVYVDDSDTNNPLIGIGTDTPTEKLDVNGSVNVRANIQLSGHLFGDQNQDPNNVMLLQNDSQIQLHGDSHSGKPGGIVIGPRKDDLDPKSGKVIFSQNKVGGGWDTKMILDHNGNVGIGTSTPQNKIEVDGSGGVGTGLMLPTGAGDDKVLASDGSGNGIWKDYSEVTNGLWKKNGNDIVNGNTGNVGIENANIEWNKTNGGDRFTIRASNTKGSYMEFFKEDSSNNNAGGITFVTQGNGVNNGFVFAHHNQTTGNWSRSIKIDGNGDSYFYDNSLFLRSTYLYGGNQINDVRNGLRYLNEETFDNKPKLGARPVNGIIGKINGPYLFGEEGGALGSAQDTAYTGAFDGAYKNIALQWFDDKSVEMKGKLQVNGDANFDGNISIDNNPPFIIKEYTFLSNDYQETINNYSAYEYDAFIGSIRFLNMGTVIKPGGIYVDEHFVAHIKTSGSNFILEAFFPSGHGGNGANGKTKKIEVIFINRKLVRRD